jgi:hypothetical protein
MAGGLIDRRDAKAYIAGPNAKVHRERPSLQGLSGRYRLPGEAEWGMRSTRRHQTARRLGEVFWTSSNILRRYSVSLR